MRRRPIAALLAAVAALAAAELPPAVAAPRVPARGVHDPVMAAAMATDWSAFASRGGAVRGSATREASARRALRAAAGSAGGATRAQASEVSANQFFDTCRDTTASQVDVRSTVIAQTQDPGGAPDQTGFLAYSCVPFEAAQLGRAGISWGIDTEDEPSYGPGTDFVVSIFPDGPGLAAAVARTPSADRSTWYLTWETTAQRLDDFEVDAVVPTRSIGGVGTFVFTWAASDTVGVSDVFPEEYADDQPQFPNECTGLISASARPGADPAADDAAPTSARAAAQRSAASRLQVAPNDPGYPQQWSLPNISAHIAWGTASASGVRVAVIDDGVDGTRPDLAGRVEAGYDTRYERDLPAGSDSDRGGHGTAASGLLGAAGGNGVELAGVDWGARILPIRTVDSNGCISDRDVAEGIDWAVAAGARVVNISLGGEDSERVRHAVDAAFSAGVVVVAAAGNGGLGDDTIEFPAGYPAVVAVGATTRDGVVAPYSSTGRHLDVVAPGGDNSGTAERDVLILDEWGRLTPVAGTSYAAPLVTGAISLYLGVHPTATPDDVRIALQDASTDLGVPGHDPQSGFGQLNVAALLAVPATGGPIPDPATFELPRVDAGDPAAAALAVSRDRFPDGDASHVVLAREDVFADALAGAPLTDRGPLLLGPGDRLHADLVTEAERALGGLGTVYVLGGASAVSDDVVAQWAARGHRVRRLAGASRVETALAIATEVRELHPGGDTVALARAGAPGGPSDTAAWADAVSGGAWAASAGVPVLVTGSDAVHPAVAAALAAWAPRRTVLLGGAAALSAAVEANVPGAERVGGTDRAGTAAAVAAQLWPTATGFTVTNGWSQRGWAYGLVAAGLAADAGAPLLLVDRATLPSATQAAVVAGCTAGARAVRLVGDAHQIGGSVETALAEASSC